MSVSEFETYFREALSFFKTHQWIYNYRNTHVLVNKVFSNFPLDWQLYFQTLTFKNVNDVIQGLDNFSESFKQILCAINALKSNYVEKKILKCEYDVGHNSGLSNKKLQEILNLAPHIDEICNKNGLNFIIDVGAGLGYLSHLLHEHYDYPVLGLECSPNYVKRAYQYQNKLHPASKSKVIFHEHFIDENSSETISRLSDNYFPLIQPKKCCLVGLHACADLSVTILKLFLQLDFVKAIAIMPCCYHRMTTKKDDPKCRFENFPCSETLKKVFDENEGWEFIGGPFLRVACQETLGNFVEMSDEEHERHARSLMYRAVLQQAVETENYKIRRLKRKTAPSGPHEDFSSYSSNLKSTHDVTSSDGRPLSSEHYEAFLKKLNDTWRFHHDRNDLISAEILTGLQALIQDPCENLVLLDRAVFLMEKGIKCHVVKVTDDAVSPRCHALIAVKDL